MSRIVVGTSGWQYDSWRRRFYPADLPTSAWLAYFSERFASVEVNNTFYRLPEAATFAKWHGASADGFEFAVKASRYITHVKRLADPEEPVRTLWERAQRLGDKLGPILFQLPPRFPADPRRLAVLLDVLPRGMRAAFEFRDRSWETDETFELLDAAGAAFVLADRPRAKVPHVVTGGWVYVRFHEGRLDVPDYPRPKLRRWAKRLSALDADRIYVYFNNDTGGAAIRDAVAFREMVA